MTRSYLLLNNKSKCCNAPIQRATYLYGGMGGYTGVDHICTKCHEALEDEKIIYEGKKNE